MERLGACPLLQEYMICRAAMHFLTDPSISPDQCIASLNHSLHRHSKDTASDRLESFDEQDARQVGSHGDVRENDDHDTPVP